MKQYRLVFAVFALALLSMFSGVQAQERESGDVDLDVTVREDNTMSGPEQLAWVESNTENAKRTAFRVQSMLDGARREKDALKITCLDDKLTQIHVNLRGVEERTVVLKASVKANDASTANQQFSILSIYLGRIDGLRVEAETCLGEVDMVLGETETIVTIDDDITLEDPAEDIIIVDDVGVEPTPHASGYY